MTCNVSDPHQEAIDQFNEAARRHDGKQVAESLAEGLNLVRNLFYERIHRDVETIVGADSMLVPLSEMKTYLRCKSAIDIYQIVESAWAVRHCSFLAAPDDWYLSWLARQRLDATLYDAATAQAQTLQRYWSQSPEQRRRELMDTLLDVLPESGRAPLVLFSLLPLAVHLATVLAFGDQSQGQLVRKQQRDLLPALTDCRACRGAVLVNGEQCRACGNPLWQFACLTAT